MRLFEGTVFDRPPRCEVCEELEDDCTCPPPTEPRTPPERQTAKVFTEKRKRGKVVTVIKDLADEGDHLRNLLTQLKSACGAGGTLKDGVLEIQGDQSSACQKFLADQGYRVR